MAKICDNTSVGQIIRKDGGFVIIKRYNYPEAFALPAGHVDQNQSFAEAATRETKEEVGLTILENKSVFKEDIGNSCKREGGSHHLWEVFEALRWDGELSTGSDAKSCQLVSEAELKTIAARTEYFMKKYKISYDQVGKLTTAIFGNDPDKKNTDPEWRECAGLEPVWYYILRKIGMI